MFSTRMRHLLLAILSLVTAFVAGQQVANAQGKLTPQEQKVIDFLVNDWGKDYSVTSVDLAMDAVGVMQSDETRFRIGSYVKSHPEIHEVVRQWGWVTLVLTPNEKLIARALINAQRKARPVPTGDQIAADVGITESEVMRGVKTLERYKIVQRDRAIGGIGYKALPRYIKWEPRLDFLFHTVTLANGRRFNTN